MSFCRTYLLHGKRKNACICEGCSHLVVHATTCEGCGGSCLSPFLDGTEIADPCENDAKSEAEGKGPVPKENGS